MQHPSLSILIEVGAGFTRLIIVARIQKRGQSEVGESSFVMHFVADMPLYQVLVEFLNLAFSKRAEA